MAYQTRDPLFDSATQAVLEQRGKELLGFGFLITGALLALMLASYVPDDPSWLSVTDEPAQNLFGRAGASISAPLIVILGGGAWLCVAIMLIWGARLVFHKGSDRIFPRAVLLPFCLAVGAMYFSTHLPGAGWTHSFGLGGLLGDTLMGLLLNALPMPIGFALKVLAILTAIAMIVLALFVAGFSREELREGAAIGLGGVVLLYAQVMQLLDKAIIGARGQIQTVREYDFSKAGQSEPGHVEPGKTTIVRSFEPQSTTEMSQRGGIFGRLLQRNVQSDHGYDGELAPQTTDGEDRIKLKIADVIRTRSNPTPAATMPRVEPPLSAALDALDPPEQDVTMPESELVENMPSPPPMFQHRVQNEPRKAAMQSERAKQEAQPDLPLEDKFSDYELPPLSLLAHPDTIERHVLSNAELEENARTLETVLEDYGVKGEIVSVRPGPVVTMYELEPAPGLKASRVIGLADDIARSMSALSARVSTVPGRSVIGIELPNEKREMVNFREILSGRDYENGKRALPLALGKDIAGAPVVANLAKMPHLLIAGTTGSGKSVAINTMIMSLLYKLSPKDCRLIMIDPKMLELSVYDGIPHLLSPVVTDPKKAVVALKWVVGEMEDRYRKMSKMGVRNIDGYNSRVADALGKNELFSRTVQTGFDDATGEPVFETEEFAPEKMPYIVVIVDEMADLMMVAGKEIEACIQRLAQMARASGIHLIMATQRPSVDVITGTIKANFPTRISFQVTSKIDSRTILGEQGAEQLLGMGDMLYMAGGSKISRVHGPFCSDEEVEEIVNHLKAFGPPDYVSGVVQGPDDEKAENIDAVLGLGGNTDGEASLYDQAVAIVARDRKCSTSYIQRKLAIGYNKAARLVEQMEDEGVVSAANHVGKREILVPEVE